MFHEHGMLVILIATNWIIIKLIIFIFFFLSCSSKKVDEQIETSQVKTPNEMNHQDDENRKKEIEALAEKKEYKLIGKEIYNHFSPKKPNISEPMLFIFFKNLDSLLINDENYSELAFVSLHELMYHHPETMINTLSKYQNEFNLTAIFNLLERKTDIKFEFEETYENIKSVFADTKERCESLSKFLKKVKLRKTLC